MGHFPLCFLSPEMRASFRAGLTLTGADGDILAVSIAMPRAFSDAAAASCAQSTQLG